MSKQTYTLKPNVHQAKKMDDFIAEAGQQVANPSDTSEYGADINDSRLPEACFVNIDSILRSRFQNRSRVPQEEIDLLAEDIKRDGLRNPVVLRQVSDGQYELVSGETRVEAFRSLGRTEIQAFVRRMDDMEAARGTVLDNFFHRDLTDFEIYKGMKILTDCGAATSLAQLSSLTKWGRTHVHRFMSFGKLPQEALDILEASPCLLLSAKIAGDFAKLMTDGMPALLVADALRLVADGKLDSGKAARWAEKKWRKAIEGDSDAPDVTGRQAITLPSGKLAYTITSTPRGLVVAAEKGMKSDLEELGTELAAWLSERMSKKS